MGKKGKKGGGKAVAAPAPAPAPIATANEAKSDQEATPLLQEQAATNSGAWNTSIPSVSVTIDTPSIITVPSSGSNPSSTASTPRRSPTTPSGQLKAQRAKELNALTEPPKNSSCKKGCCGGTTTSNTTGYGATAPMTRTPSETIRTPGLCEDVLGVEGMRLLTRDGVVSRQIAIL